MIILGCESIVSSLQVHQYRSLPEDSQRSTFKAMCYILVLWSQQSADGKLASLDPDVGSLVDRFKRHHSAICARNHPSLISWRLDRTGTGFEFTVKEFVERLERVDGVEYLIYR